MEQLTPDDQERKPFERRWADFEIAMELRAHITHHVFPKDKQLESESREAEQFDAWVGDLPVTDPEFAVRVYQALVASDSVELRGIVGTRVQLLYHVDKEAALPLWEQLIEDADEYTSSDACYMVEVEIEAGRLSGVEAARLLGLATQVRDRWFLRESGIEPD